MENKNVKKRIKIDKPNEKWTEDVVIQIINYFRKAPEIEVRKLCTRKPCNKSVYYSTTIERFSVNLKPLPKRHY